MFIVRRSMLTGKEHSMDIPVTEDQIRQWEDGDTLIQDAFPYLDEDQREFLMTGITPEEWDLLCQAEEEEFGYDEE